MLFGGLRALRPLDSGLKRETTMKMCRPTTLKYLGIGFACLVIAMAVLRAVDALDSAPVVAGAILLSLLVASTEETRRA